MISLPRRRHREATDGNLRQAVWQPGGICIPLLRPHDIPVEWAQKGVRKEDYVRPALHRMERQQRFGVYFILKSMEVGPSFRISAPKFPTADPHDRLIAPQRGRYTHYYGSSRTYGWAAFCCSSRTA